jgi:hypothetical protein
MVKKGPTRHHPLYGDIPLIEHRRPKPDGGEWTWHEPDLEFKPPLPKGAVRGDTSRQVFCSAHDVPQYFYVDIERTCLQCQETFLFGAKEQKFWCETLQFRIGSIAVRCPRCRRQKRSLHMLREQMAAALKGLETKPRDPHLLLDLARATVAYRLKTGQGNLDRAISCCRKAAEEWPTSPEPLYWEGECQRLAGRAAKAIDCLTKFVARAEGGRLAKLVAAAKGELRGLGVTLRIE